MRLRGAEKFGTKAEVKNLNSFRFLKLALDYEIARQVALIESGGRVVQETRLYNPDTGETVGMRSKEDAHDYRYFPEPDLVPLRISDAWLEQVRAPHAGAAGVAAARASSRTTACANTTPRCSPRPARPASTSRSVARVSGDPQDRRQLGDGRPIGAAQSRGKEIAESPVTAEHLGELVALIASGEITGKLAKEIFPKMSAAGEAPAAIMEREGLKQISDDGALGKIIDEVIAANPKQVEQYSGGKQQVLGFLVGQVMKASRGQADPAAVNRMFKEKL